MSYDELLKIAERFEKLAQDKYVLSKVADKFIAEMRKIEQRRI